MAQLENCAAREEAIFHEANGDESNWAFVNERGEDASGAAHMYVRTRAKGKMGGTRRTEGTDKREGEKYGERERRSRSLKAKWPGCAPCITISLGKS